MFILTLSDHGGKLFSPGGIRHRQRVPERTPTELGWAWVLTLTLRLSRRSLMSGEWGHRVKTAVIR